VLERSQGTAIWRPVPYVSVSVDGPAGTDISASFADVTQLSCRSAGLQQVGAVDHDVQRPERQAAARAQAASAMQRLATDINVACANVACLQGTLVVKRTVAASASTTSPPPTR
jgi:hypothetical protein